MQVAHRVLQVDIDFAEITLTLELGLSLEQHYSTRQEAGCLKLQLEAY